MIDINYLSAANLSLKKRLKFIPQLEAGLHARGIVIGKALAFGAHGIVYDLVSHPDKVIKLFASTDAAKEAKVSEIVRQNPHSNLERIDLVLQERNSKIFIIVAERLYPVDSIAEGIVDYNRKFRVETLMQAIIAGENAQDFAIKVCAKQNFVKRLSVIKAIYNGIEHLYRLGCVYNDIKSDNIMVDTVGNYKLIDFGLVEIKKNFRLKIPTL